MSESRICPVCGTLIPSIKMSSCPMCDYELEILRDEKAIEQAKKGFTRGGNPAKGHLIAGVIGAAFAQIVYLIGWPGADFGWQLFFMPINFVISLPAGLLTGYLVYLLEKLNRWLNTRFVFLIMTFILSTVICVLFLVIFHNNSNLPY